MTETDRIRQRIAVVEAEQRVAEKNWQRCDGALQVLRHMLGEALQQEDAASVPDAIAERTNGELPAAAGE